MGDSDSLRCRLYLTQTQHGLSIQPQKEPWGISCRQEKWLEVPALAGKDRQHQPPLPSSQGIQKSQGVRRQRHNMEMGYGTARARTSNAQQQSANVPMYTGRLTICSCRAGSKYGHSLLGKSSTIYVDTIYDNCMKYTTIYDKHLR